MRRMAFPLFLAAACLGVLVTLLRPASGDAEPEKPAASPPPASPQPPQEGPNGIRIGERFIMPRTISIPGDAEFAPCIILAGSEVAAVGFDGLEWIKVRYDRIPAETGADIPYATGIMAKECKDKSVVSFSPEYFGKLKGDMPEFPLRAGYGASLRDASPPAPASKDQDKE
jgi:hypothetical protein